MATATFYRLPAEQITAGMSTSDGQDFLDDVTVNGPGQLWAHAYTPAADPVIDQSNRDAPEARCYTPGQLVDLAVFPDTQVDGSGLPGAVPAR